MFDNPRYVTCGISNELDPVLQLLLWQLIAELRAKKKLDYLQVFELKITNETGIPMQKVIHRQEQPPYEASQTYKIDNPLDNRKIFVIDDTTHSTMLFAEEY